MAHARPEEIVDVLRQRVIRAIATGSLCVSDRLASTRDMAAYAPTYITQAARTYLASTRVRGVLIPSTRLVADDCVRAHWRIIGEVTLNSERR